MKSSSPKNRFLLVDPITLAAVCVISVLFANAVQQYLVSSKQNFSRWHCQTVVCFQVSDESTPSDRPDDWEIEKIIFQKENKNNSPGPVTFCILQDYSNRLSSYAYGLNQPLLWLPSIPIAHRKLII